MTPAHHAAQLWPDAHARVIQSALLDRLTRMAYDAPEARLYCAIIASAAEDIATHEDHHPLYEAAMEYLDGVRLAEHCERAGLCIHYTRRAVLGAGMVVGEVRRATQRQESLPL